MSPSSTRRTTGAVPSQAWRRSGGTQWRHARPDRHLVVVAPGRARTAATRRPARFLEQRAGEAAGGDQPHGAGPDAPRVHAPDPVDQLGCHVAEAALEIAWTPDRDEGDRVDDDLAAAGGSGDLRVVETERVGQLEGHLPGVGRAHPAPRAVDEGDALQHLADGFRAEALQGGEAPVAGGDLEPLDRGDAQFGDDRVDLLGPEAGHLEQVEHAGRQAIGQFVAQAAGALVDHLGDDDGGDLGADALELGEATRCGEIGRRLVQRSDQAGDPPVGGGAPVVLAEHLHEELDVAEDPGDVLVRQPRHGRASYAIGPAAGRAGPPEQPSSAARSPPSETPSRPEV